MFAQGQTFTNEISLENDFPTSYKYSADGRADTQKRRFCADHVELLLEDWYLPENATLVNHLIQTTIQLHFELRRKRYEQLKLS